MKTILQEIEELSLELNNLLPMKADYQAKLDNKFRLEFNYNSNHMEGNTLTYSETELLLIFDETKGNHSLREYEEMKAHDVALVLVKEWAADKERPLTETNIKNLNEVILVKPFWKEAITPGGQETRRLIKVGDYKEFPNSVQLSSGEIFEYASVTDTPILMQELIDWYRAEEKALHPVTLAAMLHYKFVRIHPFDDGNGRIARLLMNYVLLKNNLPSVIIKSADKINYRRVLHIADTGDFEPFIDYIGKQLIWSLETSINAAKGESIEDADDFEKEISLMEKEVEIISGENIKSREAIFALWNSSLKTLLDKYFKKFSTIEKLFNRINKRMYYSYDDHGKEVTIDGLNDWITNPSSPLERLSAINLYLNYQDMKNLHFDIQSNFQIYFRSSRYEIDVNQKSIEKKYNQIINMEEIDVLINERAEDFLKRIKSEVAKANS